MIKDSGNILLTENDLTEFKSGEVSQRVKELWGLSYEELKAVVEQNNYKVIDNNGSEATRTEETGGDSTPSSEA